jgi:hypothetical protein
MSDDDFNFPNFPCKQCGTTQKRKDGTCKHCANAASRAWTARNKDKARAAVAAWAEANKERRKEVKAAWRAANRDRINARQVEYQRENREKVSAAIAAWVENNKERYKNTAAAWRAANKDRLQAKRAEWKQANADKIKDTNAKWKAENKDAVKTYSRNRRARKANVGGVLSVDLSERLKKLQRNRCACCGKPLGRSFHMDHIIPIARGGSNTDDNMQLLHDKCNLQKGAKHPVDFMQERGFLL